MKKILLASLCLALTVGFNACKKNSDVNSSNPLSTTGLSASKKSGIKSGEPVFFALNTSRSSTNSVSWQVLPNVGVFKSVHNSKATFKFSSNGKFIVTATDGVVSDTILITVDSIPFTGTDTTTYQPYQPQDSSYYYGSDTTVFLPILANDQLVITPSFSGTYGDTSHLYADTIAIKLAAATRQTYPSTSPNLLSNISWGASLGPIFNFTGVSFYQNTLSLSTPSVATGVNFLDILTTNGSTPFSVVYNNVTYSGSVNVVGKKATFTWPYTSGVVISPLVISQ